MNRIDRLFGILLLLRRKTRLRAQDLAATFEVSERTIYRDMLALQELGVPIVSLPGEGYELSPGFYLPPLLFTGDEASAALLGAKLVAAQTQGRLVGAAEQLVTKIAAILPPSLRQQVDQLATTIEVIAVGRRYDLDTPQLALIQQGIDEHRLIALRYHSYSRNQVTEREVEPLFLTFASGTWYLNGYCRLRQGMRSFHLERIDALQLRDEIFMPRPLPAPPQEEILVQVRFAPQVQRWVRERQHYAYHEETLIDDQLICTYRIHTLDEMTPWLLSWGAAAEVLAPPELRTALRQEARKLVEILT